MKININHLAKMEGHASFRGELENGNIKQAKIITEEGARLIEGCLKGKSLFDAHVITMRICGICPIVHNLAAICAMENALGVKVDAATVNLRKMMELAQLIHSHAMHLFFLSLPDFLNFNESISLIKKYPKEAQIALDLREFGNSVNQVIGGRAIHPLNNWIGGFKVWPKKKDIRQLAVMAKKVLPDAIGLANFFAKLPYPKFERKIQFVSLAHPQEYAIYDGQVMAGTGKKYSAAEFYKKLQEVEEQGAMAKRALWGSDHFMVGALARINNHGSQLNVESRHIWRRVHGSKKVFNPFYNVLAQAVEVVHCIEEIQKIAPAYAPPNRRATAGRQNLGKIKIRAGRGLAAVEAPRGILFHYYEIDNRGRIVKANIITPTVMFLGNLEDDLSAYLPETVKMTESQRRNKIRMLIRAYDPCISCATH